MLYSLKEYYYNDFGKALCVFFVIILINCLTIVAFYLSINNLQTTDVIFFSHFNDYFADRAYIFVVDLIPLAAIMGLIYLLNKKKIKKYWEEFKQYPKETIRRKNKQTIIYYVLTIVLLGVSIFSSSFL